MLKTTLFLSSCLCLAGAAAGQTVFTLPAGHAKAAGGWGSGNGVSYPFDRGDFHYQEVHTSWKGGGARVLTKVMFRRGMRADTTTAVKRTADLSFQMGPGDLTKFTTTFTTNYTSAPTALFSQTKLSLPSRVKRPASAPAPWDITLKFAKAFIYAGKTDLVWELWHKNVSVTGTTFYYSDRASGGSYGYVSGAQLGTGCTATGQTSTHYHSMSMYNYGAKGTTYKMRMYLYTSRNPASTPVTVVLGYQKADLQIPGWCEKIYPNPFFFVPMGTSSTTGSLTSTYLSIPYLSWAIGLPIYSQAYAADSKLAGGISLSNGRTASVPKDPTPLSWRYTYALDVTSTTGKGPYTAGSVVTGY